MEPVVLEDSEDEVTDMIGRTVPPSTAASTRRASRMDATMDSESRTARAPPSTASRRRLLVDDDDDDDIMVSPALIRVLTMMLMIGAERPAEETTDGMIVYLYATYAHCI